MNNKITTRLAGVMAVVVVAGAMLVFVITLGNANAPHGIFDIANGLLNAVYISVYGMVGALILARQPRNTVGWLLLVIGLSLSVGGALLDYLGRVMSPVTAPDWTTYLSVWLNGWLWWLLIGPLLLMLLVFPTGRLLSPRWRWVVTLLVALFITFLLIATLAPIWQDPNSGQTLPNPFGWLPIHISFDSIAAPFLFALTTTLALCVASVFVRYRRSGAVEREQLKWFLYASAILPVIFSGGILNDGSSSSYVTVFSLAFDVALLLIPVSIGIAILRYHLFDIDLIIRRTLIYSILTAILLLFYFGSVIVLQQLLRSLTGAGDDLAIIVSTLAIAGLFVPLRNRVQRVIDRRFYRHKYDAAQVLAMFAATARDEVDLGRLTDELQTVVEETMQPEHISVWLTKTGAPRGGGRDGK